MELSGDEKDAMAANCGLDDLPPEIAKRIVVDLASGCWIWQNELTKGYGRVKWKGKRWLVHRLVWTLLVKPIPDGLTIDHVKNRGCTSKACCWPGHLEPVTQLINVQRANTHCDKGHKLTPDNRYAGGGGCKTCHRSRENTKNMTPERLETRREYMRRYYTMELTEDEQDALAANCGHCWSRPGEPCKSPAGRKRRPHKARLDRAARRGILGGAGRDLLEQNRKIDG